jgi:hypothetical protein
MSAPIEAPEQYAVWRGRCVSDGHRCNHCNERLDQHRATDCRCPADRPFPKLARAGWGRDEDETTKRALAAWDRRIGRFWSARTTVFHPR